MPKQPADQFSDAEMAQVKRFGQALGGAPTPFDEEVEKHYQRHAANIAKAKPTVPSDDSDNEQGSFDQKQSAEQENIANPVDYGNPPVIPGVKPKATRPSKTPDWSDLGK
jgi:hypothetical protein